VTEINLTTSIDEGEQQQYLFIFSKTFCNIENKLAKLSHLTTKLVLSLIVNNDKHLLRALDDTGNSTSNNSILETYTSAPFIKTDDSNKITWSTISVKFITTRTGICL
jgi:hypothetical protein